MNALFLIGLVAIAVGGSHFFISLIAGHIHAGWPFEPIYRRDEPERFRFWQDVCGGAAATGAFLLLVNALL